MQRSHGFPGSAACLVVTWAGHLTSLNRLILLVKVEMYNTLLRVVKKTQLWIDRDLLKWVLGHSEAVSTPVFTYFKVPIWLRNCFKFELISLCKFFFCPIQFCIT